MRKNKIYCALLALIILCCFAVPALAVPAYPGKITLSQPDGTSIKAFMRGDEALSYYVDTEGVLLKKDADGFYRQVTDGAGNPVKEGSANFSDYLPKANPLMHNDYEPIELFPQGTPETGGLNAAASGLVSIPCLILEIQFAPSDGTVNRQSMGSDGYLRWPWLQYPASDWSSQMFGDTDSAAAYYKDVSNGAFTFVPVQETDTTNGGAVNDGVVTITVNSNCAYYDALYNPWRKSQMPAEYYGEDMKQQHQWYEGFYIKDALKQAEQYVDFSSYDTNGDGILSPDEFVLYCPVAGYEMSGSENGPATWAVKWNFFDACCSLDSAGKYTTPREYAVVDGKELKEFTCGGEHYDNVYVSGLASYSTVCHELGHILGLPDLYNTKGSYMTASQNVGFLSVMAEGSWGREWGENGIGNTVRPTYMDAWSKTVMGFYTPQNAQSGKEYTLYDASQAANYNILRLNTSDPDEYYLVENREYSGYDKYMTINYAYYQYCYYGISDLHAGIVVWHIKDDIIRQYMQGGYVAHNAVNTPDHPYGVMPELLRNGNDGFPFRVIADGGEFTFAIDSGHYGRLKVLDPHSGEMRVSYSVEEYPPASSQSSEPQGTPQIVAAADAKGDTVSITQQTLPPYGADYNALKEAAGNAAVFGAYELSADSYSSLSFPLSVSFYVGRNYAGESFTVLHKLASGKIQRHIATVDKDGRVSVTVWELSPFMLLYGEQAESILPIADVPQTGGNGALWALLTLAGAAMTGAVKKRKNIGRGA